MKPLLNKKSKFLNFLTIIILLVAIGLPINVTYAATNLVTNGDFETGDSTGWTIIDNNGSGAGFGAMYTTSYEWCSISQTVDLVAAGYTTGELDAAPGIAFNVQTLQRFDHDGQYYLEYKLFAADGTTPIATQLYGSSGSPIYLPADTALFDTEYTFTGYGAGARYAYIKIAGRDGAANWGGQYGPYFDNASITIADTTNPTVSTLSPADNATNIATNSNLVITFDEAVDAETGGTISLYKSDDTLVQTFTIPDAEVTGTGTDTITINPTSDLSNETSYYVQVSATAFDDPSGNSYAGITDTTSWTFTTIAAPVTVTVTETTPQQGGGYSSYEGGISNPVHEIARRRAMGFETQKTTSYINTESMKKAVGLQPEESGISNEESGISNSGLTDIKGHWSENYVRGLAEKGVIGGYEDNTFKPDQPVTRAELSKMAAIAFEIEPEAPTRGMFRDTDNSAWYSPYINALHKKGIVQGYEGEKFMPERNVTRAEALKILLESLGAEIPGEIRSSFKDVKSDTWYEKYIAYGTVKNIVSGYDGNLFKPDQPVTRAEAAKIISRLRGDTTGEKAALKTRLNTLLKVEWPIEVLKNEEDFPDIALPKDIHKQQIKRVFRIDDVFLAASLRPSMNIFLEEIYNSKDPLFGGILIGEEGGEWQKFLEIKDDQTKTNNPYYLWQNGEKLLLSIVDSYGAGSGEGGMKVYSLSPNEGRWKLEQCYYYGGTDREMESKGYDYFSYTSDLSFRKPEGKGCGNDLELSYFE